MKIMSPQTIPLKGKIMQYQTTSVTTMLAVGLLTSTLFGCGNIVANHVGPSDYAKLENFHDSTLELKSSTQVFQNKIGSGDEWKAGYALSPAGLGKVHVKNVPYTSLPDAKGYSGYAPAHYDITVDAASAKNLKWEVWMSGNQYQMHSAFGSTSIPFQKIMGPFKAGERVKIDYLKDGTDSYGQRYSHRQALVVVYSPSERGESYSVTVHKPQVSQ